MGSTDWYRSTEWGAGAERDFRARLSRARPGNRVQYRRIKAVALLGADDPATVQAGRNLLTEVVNDPDAPLFEVVMALSLLGRSMRRDRPADAEASLRRALLLAVDNPSGTSGMEEAWLAQILLAHGDRASLEEARALIEARAADPPPFPSAQYEIVATAAHVAERLGDGGAAAQWARAALTAARAAGSGLRHDPTIGAADASEFDRAWLERAARGGGTD